MADGSTHYTQAAGLPDLREALAVRYREHYGVEVKRKGNQHQGFCPLPTHKGKRRSP